ncbi:hypothetical protein [Desulfatibacillum aliphaticivorans]|uniref:hypothetical protein n=1 Tax=Desulfatibacillum aliphaticivorans TaxID=218208 RepID=UPI00040084A9|nr:hypothetical protein [Desulfatibacillum aliphaticivorans]
MGAKKPDFRLVDGVQVTSLKGISEGYSEHLTDKGFYMFTINVSAENIPSLFLSLSSLVREPAFFLVELGANEAEEKELRRNASDPFHKNVYYLDDIDFMRAKKVFLSNERLLVHDGMVNFGFGSHNGYDEVFVGGYKIFEIYTDSPEKYRRKLAELGVPQTLTRTVWDNFDKDSPGTRNALAEEPTIWDMLDQMMSEGFYRAEIRED